MIFFPIRTKKLNDSIFAVRAKIVNMFVYRNGADTICIDTGFGKDALGKELNSLGVDISDISHVFLTHSDFDHAGCVDLFKNADIYLSKDEEKMVNGSTARMLGKQFNRRIEREYRLLNDGDIVRAGNIKVKSITTPGHTPGSMSYLVDDENLFVGDSLAITAGKVHVFPRFMSMDTNIQKESIKKLAGLNGVKMLFTAHSGYTDNFAAAMERWRRIK